MAIITIDGTEYDTETFSDEAKAKLVSVQMVERKLAELNNDVSIAKTARAAYVKLLVELLPTVKKTKKN